MPTPFDLLSEKLDDQADPDDELRLQMGQNQGANLAGGPQPMPPGGPAPQPSPNVQGPLAALAPPAKPRIKLLTKPAPKPHIKLKAKKPKPKVKLSALQGFLDAIGRTS
jgi:hypothetical protein